MQCLKRLCSVFIGNRILNIKLVQIKKTGKSEEGLRSFLMERSEKLFCQTRGFQAIFLLSWKYQQLP